MLWQSQIKTFDFIFYFIATSGFSSLKKIKKNSILFVLSWSAPPVAHVVHFFSCPFFLVSQENLQTLGAEIEKLIKEQKNPDDGVRTKWSKKKKKNPPGQTPQTSKYEEVTVL